VRRTSPLVSPICDYPNIPCVRDVPPFPSAMEPDHGSLTERHTTMVSPLRFSSLRTSILLLALLMLAGLHRPATAQVTEITTEDLPDLIGTNEVAQVFDTSALGPNTNTDLSTLINATGSGQVYDLRPFIF